MYIRPIKGFTSLDRGIYQEYDPQGGIKIVKINICLLYRLNELGTAIFTICVYDTILIIIKQIYWINCNK